MSKVLKTRPGYIYDPVDQTLDVITPAGLTVTDAQATAVLAEYGAQIIGVYVDTGGTIPPLNPQVLPAGTMMNGSVLATLADIRKTLDVATRTTPFDNATANDLSGALIAGFEVSATFDGVTPGRLVADFTFKHSVADVNSYAVIQENGAAIGTVAAYNRTANLSATGHREIELSGSRLPTSGFHTYTVALYNAASSGTATLYASLSEYNLLRLEAN